MNTISLCIALFTFFAVSECIPTHISSDFGGGYGGSSGGFGGGSGGFGGGSSGGYGGGSSGGYGGGHEEHHEDYHHEPKPYAFGYSVKDFKKGTNFNQHETSDGHYVKGEYAVALPDGRMQIVKYNADWKNGYHADVKYVGEAHHPEIYATHHEHDSGLGSGYESYGGGEGGHGASSSNFQSLGGGSHGSHGGSFNGY